MRTHVHDRQSDEGVASRSKGTRIAIALLSTAALCLGPAVAASADDAAVAAADAAPQTVVEEQAAPPAETLSETTLPEESEVPAEDPVVDDAGAAGDVSGVAEEPDEGTDAGAADQGGDDATDDGVADAGAADDADSEATGELAVAPSTAVAAGSRKAEAPSDKKEGNGHQGIGICHATGSGSNPYVFITVDVDSIFRQNGHDTHTKAGGTRSDVIPAFWYIKNGNKHQLSYPGSGSYYPGKNLDATGLYMLSNGCDQPPTVPECPSDDIAPSLTSDHGYDPECPKPPECPVYGEAERSNGNHGYDPECPKPPECPVYGDSVQKKGDHGDECPKPPECPVYGEHNGTDRSVAEVSTWSQDEKKWECPKQPEIQVDPGECITPTSGDDEYADESETLVTGSNLKPGRDYLVTVTMGEYEVFSDEFEADGEGMIYAWVSLSDAGWYTATIASTGHKPRSASTEFEIAECPPVVVPQLTAVASCVAGELNGTISGADLAWEESYPLTVSGPNGFAWNGTLTGGEDGTAAVTIALGVAGNYVASVEGAQSVEFAATLTCAKTTVVVTSKEPALVNTGSSGTVPMLWTAAVAMILATGLMLEPVLSRRAKR